eukprot:5857862-Karenia_brevis.AAC.1
MAVLAVERSAREKDLADARELAERAVSEAEAMPFDASKLDIAKQATERLSAAERKVQEMIGHDFVNSFLRRRFVVDEA